MQINAGNKQMLQGSFNIRKKNSDKDEQSNVIKKKDENQYEKTIKGLEEQMKEIRMNDTDDAEVKKQKIKGLQDKIKELRKLQQEEEMKKLNNEDKKKNETENVYQKNADGDKLTLSDQMKEMLKGERKVKKQEEKSQLKTKLETKASMLETQIEKDKGRNKSASNAVRAEASVTEKEPGKLPDGITERDLEKMDYAGYDAKHNGKELDKLKEAIERIDNNEVDKLDKTEEDESKNVFETVPEIEEDNTNSASKAKEQPEAQPEV